MKKILFILLICYLDADTPKNFVNLKEYIPSLKIDMRYYGSDNFVGKSISGYCTPKALLTIDAADALKKVQKDLQKIGLGLKIFDAYRPQQAVDDFVKWSFDLKKIESKKKYYPHINKKNLFQKGYIAKKSGHSRGSTLDLTIINLSNTSELDMGTPFDFFGERSSFKCMNITKEQQTNRMLLRSMMLKYDFQAYSKEWWHFTLKNEPYKYTYFNFLIQ